MCLDRVAELGDPITVSPRTLGADEKIDRWLQVWVPDVELMTFGH
jgi:hypothetical protein